MLKCFTFAAALLLSLASCSKDENKPKVFLPVVMSPDGRNLDALRAKHCNGKNIDLRDNVLTEENFRAIFQCANYDSSLNELEPLFNSAAFPKIIESLNLVLKHGTTKELKDTLKDWLGEGPQGNSRVDRLLPFLANMIKNPSFQDFLPVLDGILQAGRDVWKDLLPGLADVVYTELFPDNIENAFVIFQTFSEPRKEEKADKSNADAAKPSKAKDDSGKVKAEDTKESKDYAKSIKDVARFLKSDLEGKSVSMQILELANDLDKIQPAGSSLYQFLEHALEKGTISAFFLDSGKVRGEIVDPKINESPDPENEACAGLNETPEQRQECALQRLFARQKNGGEAPLTELAQLVSELQKDHSELLPDLAAWFASNGPRVIGGLHGFAIKSQLNLNISKLTLLEYLKSSARKQGIELNAQVNADQLAGLLRKAFADSEFRGFLEAAVPAINRDAFGERNANYLQGSSIAAEIAALYSAPELGEFSKIVIPNGTLQLGRALNIFNNKHRNSLEVFHLGKKQLLGKHLTDGWVSVVKAKLGEDIVLEYVIKLTQSLATQMATDFKNKGQPIAEWYFTSPYGNPSTTETLLGFALKELDVLTQYRKHKDWLRNEFAEEAFQSADDKRAWKMLIDQVPNIILYVRSGMSRTGGDLTRALARDKDGFLVRSYVSLIEKVVEKGWLSKGVRLVEAWNNRPGKLARAKAFTVSDEIPNRRKFKMGVEAAERIVRSLIQPQREGDYSTATISRLVTPLSSITSEARRNESERFLLTSADQLLALDDKKINEFLEGIDAAKPPGTVSERRETFRSISDLLRNPNFPDVVRHLATLFKDQAVIPALKFVADKIGDGSLPNVLLMIRRMLGFA
jgi:hypothetical protein